MMQALVTCCHRLAGQNTCSFGEIIQTANLYGEYACVGAGEGTKLANKSLRKKFDTNWIRIALHYMNAIKQSSSVHSFTCIN